MVAWEPPKEALESTVSLAGHTGWVRALATCGRWLFSGSCSTVRQWDMSRAVPRHQRDVKLDKGDVQALTTGGNRVYACSADGGIQCAPAPCVCRCNCTQPTRHFADNQVPVLCLQLAPPSH